MGLLLILSAALATPRAPVDTSSLERLEAWYHALGDRAPDESFTQLITRAAQLQRGRPYWNPPPSDEPERLSVNLTSFHCISLLETTLAVARCTWLGNRDRSCFLREIEATRYRDGKLEGYGARLHYLEDWLRDNAGRGRLALLTEALGGLASDVVFSYMTRHRGRYPALKRVEVQAEIAAAEQRLTESRPAVIDRSRILAMQDRLLSGDLVGIATQKPGMLLTHAGWIVRGSDGRVRLLHASSYHGRVVLTGPDLADYVTRRPERIGIVVARPLAP